MARMSEHGIRLSSMSPSFLNSNSTSHTWPFSAFAELIDNASDPGVTAKQIWIDVVEEQGQLCLSFTDNGSGMTPNKLHKMLSFGFTEKGKNARQAIGVYGNGFKSGSMRLGRDALIFTKNGGCLTVGMLSQSYLQAVRAQAVIVPIVPFNQQTKALVVTEDSEASLAAILEHSLLRRLDQLLLHFDSIPSKKGTKILIWNIRRNKDGKPELDFESDDGDVRMPDVHIEELKKSKRTVTGPQRADLNIPEMDFSLRAYLSILYLKPRTQIILRQKKVPTKLVAKSLSHIENDVYKPQFNKERVKVTFGFNRKNKDHYGIMMYHKNRLIKAYEKVGYQIKSSGQREGVGVIGVIECNFLKPAHNKQDFEYTREYRLTLGALGLKLNDYWREMKEKRAREREFTALERSQEEPDSEEEEEEEEESPVWLQCEDCLKWRRVPEGHYTSTPEHWNCGQNPIPRFRNCLLPEEAEESEEELTPSYHKNKKQDQAQVRRRGKSLEDSHTRFRALTRGLSEPTLLRPLPPADTLTHSLTHTLTHTLTQDGAEEPEEDTAEVEEESVAHSSSSNKRKSTWPPADRDKRPRPWAEPLPPPSDQPEEEVHHGKDGNNTNNPQPPPSSSLASSRPHSLPSAQTVVVTPLSRPEGLAPWPLSLEGGDREALVQKVASLEKEAQRLRAKLGMTPTTTPDAMATSTSTTAASPSPSLSLGEKLTGCGAALAEEVESSLSPVVVLVPLATKESICQTEVQMGRLRREKVEGQNRRQAEGGGEIRVIQETLNSIRGNVVALLSAILPHLDLQGISLDTADVDSILQQIVDANSLV